MSNNEQETEAKFYVQDLNKIKEHLEQLGAQVTQERVLESNLRFDLPNGSFRAHGRVLRLRRDTESKFTYKGEGKNAQGLLSRQEIEFTVSDFDKAKQFLEALGFRQVFYYEKYRTTCELDQVSFMLDELPYGDFLEIEGEEEEKIHTFAKKLDLNWDVAIGRSYTELFDDLREKMNLPFRDLSFANFANVKVQASDLQVRAADA